MKNAKLITSNNQSDYFFIEFQKAIEIDIDGAVHFGQFQTGHTFINGDYSMPSNEVTVYSNNNLLNFLDFASDDEVNDQFRDYANQAYGLGYTAEEWVSLLNEFNTLREAARHEVAQLEREADDEFKNNGRVYILTYKTDENGKQCSESLSRECVNREVAEKFLEKEAGYIVDKATAYSNSHEHMSNF